MEFEALNKVNFTQSNVSHDYSKKISPSENSINKAETKRSEPNKLDIENSSAANGSNVEKEHGSVEETIRPEFFDKFIQEANKKIFSTNREFSYSVHEATNRISIKVIDRETKEIIKEIPPEKALDAAAKMMELVGVIIDEKI